MQANASRVQAVQAREAAEAQNVNAQMALAQQAAIHPGDENLSCDQLQAEMMADTHDPSIQSMGDQATGMIADAKEQQKAAMPKAVAVTGAQFALSTAGAMVPGGNLVTGNAQEALAVAQSAAFARQAEQQEPKAQQLYATMGQSMYPMMRAHHVMELAKAKNCGFAAGFDVPPVPTLPQRPNNLR
jgi:hypothetical protein